MEQFNLPVTHSRKKPSESYVGKLHETQKRLDEVLEVVRNDINRFIEREGRLQNLTERLGEMEARAEQFSRKANRVRRNAWWRSVHLTMALVAACMLVVVGLVG
ncbi:unnamed protein product [Thelazia callipaeda]|uniref:V-SNARE coiled-coil homology domain-containing protein n=1 Tax=Thelazia callipaeda TaxID=103827 RepID=A0A0N5CL21_THECL|nr:unnamed protein product [Thelazia callipaeda]